jgi:hypothetical protein
MLTVKQKQDVISPINEILAKVILKKTELEFEYERWIDECIDQNIFTLEGETPVNTKYNNKASLLDKIHRDIGLYKELVSKFLNLEIPTVTVEHCLKDVKKECDAYINRLALVDKIL